MSKYRNALPQLGSKLFLTDGGLETTLIFHLGIDLPHFASCELLRSKIGRSVLAEYFLPYIETARREKLGFVLEAPTWRANPDWGAKLGYSGETLADVNRAGIALMEELRFAHEMRDVPMVISGNIGPRGDGYVAGAEMTVEAAAEYHDGQVALFADSAADREALAHCGQMAAGFGVAVEKVAPSLLGQGREGLLFRDAIRLNRPVLEPALDTWLAEIGVERPEISGLRIGLDGSAVVATSAVELVAHQAVLADDTAIIAWLPLQHWPMLLRRQAGATILTTPTKPLAAPAMVQIGSGTVLKQQAEGGIAALGSEDLAVFSGRLQALLGRDRQVEQAGQTGYQRLVSIDGGPLVGRAAGQGADIVAGLGMAGAFLAPALARWLAGAASPAEAAWFGARLVNRDPNDRRVAEFAPPLSEAKP